MSDDIILNIEKEEIFTTNDVFFLHEPEIEPPVIFNYCTDEKYFFENELPNKYYYYFEIDHCKDVDIVLSSIKHELCNLQPYSICRKNSNTQNLCAGCKKEINRNYNIIKNKIEKLAEELK